MRRILCLHLSNWPIQRLLASLNASASSGRPKLPRSPASALLLHARDPRRGDLVVACNSAAVEDAARLGMPLAEASALAQHGGQCHILPHDAAADLAALAHLAAHCERFSPLVGWQTADGSRSTSTREPTSSMEAGAWNFLGPDTLFLDVTGIGVLFGGEENLAREAIASLASLSYSARAAIDHSIGAAWAAARQENHLTAEGPLAGASGLSIAALRLPPKTIALLNQLGVQILDELLALPRDSLRSRFGEQLLLRIDQRHGTAEETIVPHRPPPQFIAEQVLEYPAEQWPTVEHVVRKLVETIAAALANRREGVLKLACRLDCAPGRPLLLEVGLFRPSADAQHVGSLLQMQLEQSPRPGPVGRVRLEAVLTAPLENKQGELFAGNQHQTDRQFALLVDRCSSRLGPQAVLRPQLTADPLPERAIKYRPGVNRQPSKSKASKTKPSKTKTSPVASPLETPAASACCRPLFVYSPPVALKVISISPHGPPISFRFQETTHQMAACAGPERIETGWWRASSARRDYWRIETTASLRFWLFRNLATGRWFLHGEC